MRVAIVSDNEGFGGAAICAQRLACGLLARQVEVFFLVRLPDPNAGHPWQTFAQPRGLSRRTVASLLEPTPFGLPYHHWMEGSAQRWLRKTLHHVRPDVISIHNLHGAFSVGWSALVAETCLDQAPAAWTLHDMWSFTGRCAYAFTCRRFITGCDASCPTPEEYPALAPGRISSEWNSRKNLLGRWPNLVAVSPSRWLEAEAKAGLWRNHAVWRIPYGIPLDKFKPMERQAARRLLGIGTSNRIILFAAHSLSDPRKGGPLLRTALKARPPSALLVTMGRGDLPQMSGNFPIHHLGFLSDEKERALALSAADLVVHPAPVDNLPNVVMESIACGTPVLAFPVGGLPDLVRRGQSGWLAREVSPSGLADALADALEDVAAGMTLRESCRSLAESEYGLEKQADRYLSLFRSLQEGASPLRSS